MKKIIPLIVLLSLVCCKNLSKFFHSKTPSPEIEEVGMSSNLLTAESRARSAANIRSNWQKFELAESELVKATWWIKIEGAKQDSDSLAMLKSEAQGKLSKTAEFTSEKSIAKEGKKPELKVSDFSISMTFGKRNQESISPWKSNKAVECSNFNLLSGQRYASYLCDLNGSIRMKLNF